MIDKVCEYSLRINGRDRAIRFLIGDICSTSENYDILVCSAFKGNYAPTPSTLIGALHYQCQLDIGYLATEPDIDLKSIGCWLSKKTGNNHFRRIACVEMLEPYDFHITNAGNRKGNVLDSISSMRFLWERAFMRGIALENIATPIIGAGNQGIPVSEVVPVLIKQCMTAFQTIETLRCVSIFGLKPDFLPEATKCLNEVIHKNYSA